MSVSGDVTEVVNGCIGGYDRWCVSRSNKRCVSGYISEYVMEGVCYLLSEYASGCVWGS